MDQLRQSDTKRLLDFVRDCYATRNVAPFELFHSRFVTALSRLIPSLHVSYAEFSLETPDVYHVADVPEISTPEVRGLVMRHIHGHVPLAHYMQTRVESALTISDFLSQRQFRDTSLYSDFYGKYDVEDDLCLGLSSGTAAISTIAWHSDRPFTNGERRLADLARPHIIQAWQNARIFSRMHDQLNLLKQGLDCAALGMIACEAQGRVRLITALARQYLAEYFGGSKHTDRLLPQELLGWVRVQNSKLKTGDLPPARSALVTRRGDKQLIVRMLSSDGTNLLLLEELVSTMNIAATEGHALSRREREVLAWAAQGKTNSEIAAILGISPQTAKKHIEHILHKMGVENRTAAVALALQSLSPDK